jgi:hypothetical protein
LSIGWFQNLIKKVNAPLGKAGCTGAANPIDSLRSIVPGPIIMARPGVPQHGLVPSVPEPGDCALAGRVAKATTNAKNPNSAILDSLIIRKSPKRRFCHQPDWDTTCPAHALAMRF